MFKKNENSVGDIKGNYNQVIQIILSDGEKVVENLGVLIDRLVNNEKKEIGLLSQNIEAKEEALKDKRKIIESQDVEIIRLKTVLSNKQKELEKSEKRFAEIYIKNNGKDYSGSQELYPQALQALINGDRKSALAILERQKLLEQKTKLDKEKEQQASSWLLRADLLKEDNNWGSDLDECYQYAADIFPNWVNNLKAADHFYFLNQLDKARKYFNFCLDKAGSDLEKATTLNNLANLQRDKNEFEQSLSGSFRDIPKISRSQSTNLFTWCCYYIK